MKILLRATLVVGLCSISAKVARADEKLDQSKAHYTAGVELFQKGEYEQAATELEAAYALKPIPKFLFDIAKTYLKLEDKPAALRFCRQFLREARIGDPDRSKVEELVKELEKEVKEDKSVEDFREVPQPTEVPNVTLRDWRDEPAQAQPVEAKDGLPRIIHTPIDEATVNQPIPVMAQLPSGLKTGRVFVLFREGAGSEFEQVEMEPQGNAYMAEIPATKVRALSIPYYLEARNAKGKTVALSANSYNPHIIVVQGGKAPESVVAGGLPPKYRTWTWILAGTGGALLAAGITCAIFAHDRESAIESAVGQSLASAQRYRWDFEGIRDLEDSGQRFATVSKVLILVGTLTAAGAGALWYLDWRRENKTRSELGPLSKIRFSPLGMVGEF